MILILKPWNGVTQDSKKIGDDMAIPGSVRMWEREEIIKKIEERDFHFHLNMYPYPTWVIVNEGAEQVNSVRIKCGTERCVKSKGV